MRVTTEDYYIVEMIADNFSHFERVYHDKLLNEQYFGNRGRCYDIPVKLCTGLWESSYTLIFSSRSMGYAL